MSRSLCVAVHPNEATSVLRLCIDEARNMLRLLRDTDVVNLRIWRALTLLRTIRLSYRLIAAMGGRVTEPSRRS